MIRDMTAMATTLLITLGTRLFMGWEGRISLSRNVKIKKIQSATRKERDYHMNGVGSTRAIVTLILLLGLATSSAFLALGISSAFKEQEVHFERSAADLVKKIQSAWGDYVNAASLIHNRCRTRSCSRTDFRDLYEYLIASGLNFQAIQFDPYVTHDERASLEEEALSFFAENYPHVNYRGIVGVNHENTTILDVRDPHDFYLPIHYMEPIIGNEEAIDMDYHASGSRRRTVESCLSNGKPALTDRLQLVQEKARGSYGVVLMHPGIKLQRSDVWPHDIASIVIRIPDLLKRSAENQGESSQAYIYDKSDSSADGYPRFLGAVQINPDPATHEQAQLVQLDEVDFREVLKNDLYLQEDVLAANKVWTVVVVAVKGTFQPYLLFIILGGVIIFLASVCLALWVNTNAKINVEKAQAEAGKARAERELNDFIAHEVRNPVAAAMAACSFVTATINKSNAIIFESEDAKSAFVEDVQIIDNSLNFANDLLRNMLDMHRAMSKQVKVEMTQIDILHDILEPVDGMLNLQRSCKTKVIVNCPKNLVVLSDRLRLKQIILNLGRNSSKFVDGGFIRLGARVVNNGTNVQLIVEDSGPGIPLDKRDRLFVKFQESLDVLSQGTGIGLFLCKSLVELMGGDISLDENYYSGVPGCPGTRFVVSLNQPPIDFTLVDDDSDNQSDCQEHNGAVAVKCSAADNCTNIDLVTLETDKDIHQNGNKSIAGSIVASPLAQDLPAEISVLFVDDDPILRKLFSRSIKRVAPGWKIHEAGNGESAIRRIDGGEHFDLFFVDMYMASVEKQLLGTETVDALRSRGIKSRICGLSANDKETEFLEAGADAFIFKPFPCKKDELKRELCRILYG